MPHTPDEIQASLEAVLESVDNHQHIFSLYGGALHGIASATLDLNTKVDKGFQAIDRRFEGVDRRFESIDRRIDKLDTKVDKLDTKVDVMRDEMRVMNATMERILGFVRPDDLKAPKAS